LKREHFGEVLSTSPPLDWFEVHSENYMAAGGPDLHKLLKIRQDYPLSLHGVSLSLGSPHSLDQDYLNKLVVLVEKVDPCIVSEHLAWSRVDGKFLNDLLPVPYTTEALKTTCAHVDQLQSTLKRPILIENPTVYVEFSKTEFTEPEFLNEITQKTGCGLLLDINNIYVSAKNNHFNAQAYIDTLHKEAVGQMHLAGHTLHQEKGFEVLIDTHIGPTPRGVLDLFAYALDIIGPTATLVEWDQEVPPFEILEEDALKAKKIMISASSKKKCHA